MSHDFRYWAWFTVSVCSIGNTTWFWPVCHIWKKVCKDNQKEKLWNRNRRHTLKLWKWSLEILWFTNSLHAWFFWSVHIIMPVCWLHAGIFSISFSVLLIKRHPYIVYVCGVCVYLFIFYIYIFKITFEILLEKFHIPCIFFLWRNWLLYANWVQHVLALQCFSKSLLWTVKVWPYFKVLGL